MRQPSGDHQGCLEDRPKPFNKGFLAFMEVRSLSGTLERLTDENGAKIGVQTSVKTSSEVSLMIDIRNNSVKTDAEQMTTCVDKLT